MPRTSKTHVKGRPRKLTVKKCQELVDSYFVKDGDRPTLFGLAVHMGIDRDTLTEWMSEKDGKGPFSGIIRGARSQIADKHAKRLFDGRCTGSIYWLKSVMGQNETIIQEHTGDIAMTIKISGDIEV